VVHNLVKRDTALCLILFFLCAFGYVVYRSSSPMLVWDDTPHVAYARMDAPHPIRWHDRGFLAATARIAFSAPTGSGYRPLSAWICELGTAWFARDPALPSTPWFIFTGICIGLFAVSFFLVSRRFLDSNLLSLFAVFLVLSSAPFIVGSWVVFAGVQVIVPLLICVGLLLYWSIAESPSPPFWRYGALAVLLFVGPWFREFIGLLAVLIILQEIQRRRFSVLAGLAALGFVHALFPTALPRLLFFHDLPLRIVFSLGSLGTQVAMQSGANLSQMMGKASYVTLNFYSLYPPLLWALTAAGIIASIRARQKAELKGGLLFLVVWFLLAFIPFLKVYTEQVHLAYSLLPASILASGYTAFLLRSLSGLRGLAALWRYAALAALVVAVIDHGLTLYGSRRVVDGINKGIVLVGKTLRSTVPKGSVVISRAYHTEDIRLAIEGYVTMYWTTNDGIAMPARALETWDKLETFLREHRNRTAVYFLDVDSERLPERAGLRLMECLHNRLIPLEDLGCLHTTSIRYPFIDWLRTFTPSYCISFLGAPDLVGDFYRGMSLDGRPLTLETRARYTLYRALDDRGPVRIAKERFCGFDLYEAGGRYYAIPRGEGAFSLERARGKGYSRCFSADSVSNLERHIQGIIREQPTPYSILEDVQGVNRGLDSWVAYGEITLDASWGGIISYTPNFSGMIHADSSGVITIDLSRAPEILKKSPVRTRWKLPEPDNFKGEILGIESVRNTPCRVISFTPRFGMGDLLQQMMWVGSEDSLIRRIRYRYRKEGFVALDVRYGPVGSFLLPEEITASLAFPSVNLSAKAAARFSNHMCSGK
jgi:hypothetical protein